MAVNTPDEDIRFILAWTPRMIMILLFLSYLVSWDIGWEDIRILSAPTSIIAYYEVFGFTAAFYAMQVFLEYNLGGGILLRSCGGRITTIFGDQPTRGALMLRNLWILSLPMMAFGWLPWLMFYLLVVIDGYSIRKDPYRRSLLDKWAKLRPVFEKVDV